MRQNHAETVRPLAGQRRYTTAMLTAWNRLPEAPDEALTKGRIITAFKRSWKALGCSKAVRDFVLALLNLTYPCDWEPGQKPIAGPSNIWLGEELDIGRSQIKNLSRQAAESGLISFIDSPTGARYVKRHPHTNQIVYGYGFDLSPLARRYGEMLSAIDAGQERRREGTGLRHAIFTTRKEARTLFAYLIENRQDHKEDHDALDAIEALADLPALEIDPSTLAPVHEQIVTFCNQLSARVTSVVSVESGPQGSPELAPITTTNPKALAFSVKEAEMPFRHQVDMNEGGSRRLDAHEDERVRTDGGHKHGIAENRNALNGFVASPSFILKIAPAFRDAVSTSKPTERDIIEAAAYFTVRLGISTHAWGQACVTFGRYTAAVIVAVIAAKTDRNLVRQPGGLLRAMIERHQNGTLHLDRTLYGLADAISTPGHA